MHCKYALLMLGVLYTKQTRAQQFQSVNVWVYYDNLSSACALAVNSTITCDDSLPMVYEINGGYLGDEILDSLCTDTCLGSLQNYRTLLKNSCSSTDIITASGMRFPAIYGAEQWILQYENLCLKDDSSGQYCNTIAASKLSKGGWAQNEMCADCLLEWRQQQLNSPFGYMQRLAEAFESTTSSCGNTNFPYTSPAYAIRGTIIYSGGGAAPVSTTGSIATGLPTATTTTNPPSLPSPTAKCISNYVIKDGDTCTSISIANSISTFSLLQSNNLPAHCNDFPGPGTSLCLPPKCTVYTVAADDTCSKILSLAASGTTFWQLNAWNPNINAVCTNLFQLVDTQICIGAPEGFVASTTTAAYTEPFIPTEPWITTKTYKTGPLVYPDVTYSAATTRRTRPTAPALPLAPGTISGCYKYWSYLFIGLGLDLAPELVRDDEIRFNDCAGVAFLGGATLEEFLEWNPSLQSQDKWDCMLEKGYQYCHTKEKRSPEIVEL